MQKRRNARVIQQIQYEHERIQKSQTGLMKAFTRYLRRNYELIIVDDECIAAMIGKGPRAHRAPDGELLERPIKMEEIRHALRKGGRNKASGSDDLGLEFYTTNWTTIKNYLCIVLNQMFLAKTTTTQKTPGNPLLAQAWPITETFGLPPDHTPER